MRVVIAPDSFKGSADAAAVATAIADGWRSVRPDDELIAIPLADGGEGTTSVIAAANPGTVWHTVRSVSGPDGRPVDARWLELPDRTAVVELAESSGLPLMRALDPLGAHTVGLGQVIADALDHGATRIVIGLGGSASTDGGSGLLTALGARLLDASGRPLAPGGGSLPALASIDLTGLRAAPPGGVSCLVDVGTPLLGPTGAAAVFGPQKGATAADVTLLDAGLAVFAGLLGGDPALPGTGAAGGTGYGLSAGWGATLSPGAATVAALVGLPTALITADLVITGEGRFDPTSLVGKVVGNVLSLAAASSTSAAIIAGQVATAAPCAALSLADLAGSAAAAIADPLSWLHHAATSLALQHPAR
ncbi:glycerate kinase [Allocatelliglobosispora scoriae]|uniref:Glycerate kinase n=1 Tax=Allocatelliglobosispora scoriae TaxID=643052 RepID=A0A841BZN1_9ACTN|nr:glycerate kinase [Allocatelliglobosispora scoriae]MBB5872252.1 glycerate kinase [Allocatelliglobosispora scoriae]